MYGCNNVCRKIYFLRFFEQKNLVKTLSFFTLCKHTIVTCQCQCICSEKVHNVFTTISHNLVTLTGYSSLPTFNRLSSPKVRLFSLLNFKHQFHHVFLICFFCKHLHDIDSTARHLLGGYLFFQHSFF